MRWTSHNNKRSRRSIIIRINNLDNNNYNNNKMKKMNSKNKCKNKENSATISINNKQTRQQFKQHRDKSWNTSCRRLVGYRCWWSLCLMSWRRKLLGRSVRKSGMRSNSNKMTNNNNNKCKANNSKRHHYHQSHH